MQCRQINILFPIPQFRMPVTPHNVNGPAIRLGKASYL